MNIVLVEAITVSLSINIVATAALYKAEDLQISQKVAQGILVWLLPIVGATIVLFVRRKTSRKSSQRCTPTFPESAIDDRSAGNFALSLEDGEPHGSNHS